VIQPILPVDLSTISDEAIMEAFHRSDIGDGSLFDQLMSGRYIKEIKINMGRHVRLQFYRWAGYAWVPEEDSTMRTLISRTLQQLYARIRDKYLAQYADIDKQIEQLVADISDLHTQLTIKSDVSTKNIIKSKNNDLSDKKRLLKKKRKSLLELSRSYDKRIFSCSTKLYLSYVLQLVCKNDNMRLSDEDWDQCPARLACLNGTIDLRTGRLLTPKREDYFNKAVPWNFEGLDKPCPKWEELLSQCFAGETELISYFSACIGQAVTGFSTKDLFWAYSSSPSAGKTLIFETIQKLLGPFFVSLSAQFFSEKRSKHPDSPEPELVSLRGNRMAVSAELTEKEYLDLYDGRVGLLTGLDPITARARYAGQSITFLPSHSLFILCNSIHRIATNNTGLAARIRIIPFNGKFIDPAIGPADPENHIYRQFDSQIMAKHLEQEMSGILAWAVRSAISVLKDGLPNWPLKVHDDTGFYFTDHDIISLFIKSKCQIISNSTVNAFDLYNALCFFCRNTFLLDKSKIMSFPTFIDVMKAHRKRIRTTNGLYYYVDLKLVTD
jgi:putative DNA primase/helicase